MTRWRETVGPALAGLGALVVLSGCTLAPERAAPVLEPAAEARVWPTPPDPPRYALAGVLVGERDFLEAKDTANKTRSAIAWLVGLVVGDPEYVELRRPMGGAVDETGRVFVADASHQAVMVFDMPGKQLLKWNQASDTDTFEHPVGVVPDGEGGILVTDSELGEVYHLNAQGQPVGRFGKGILDRPTGIARNPADGTIYVADTSFDEIKIFDPKGLLIDTLGRRGGGPGRFNAPTHLAFEDGKLFVADTLNFRVQIFNDVGDHRLSFGQIGLWVGNMTRPKGVAVGGNGRIYVVESYYDHLLVFDNTGQFLLPIGGTGNDIGQFYLPNGVWTDRQGRVYVADMFNGRVVVFKELPPPEGQGVGGQG